MSTSYDLKFMVNYKKNTYTVSEEYDGDYPGDGLFKKPVLKKKPSSIEEIVGKIGKSYGNQYDYEFGTVFAERVKNSTIAAIQDFENIEEIILEEILHGDETYSELEVYEDEVNPNSPIRIVETYKPAKKKFTRKPKKKSRMQ